MLIRVPPHSEGRTNNYAVAAHRRLQTEFSVDHSSLCRLIHGLKKVQRQRDLTYARFVSGNKLTKNEESIYLETVKRLFTLACPFDAMLPVEYLQGIPSNFVIEA